MKMFTLPRNLFVVLSIGLLSACSSDNDVIVDVGGFKSSSKSESVGPEGGSLNLTDTAGNAYVLTIPAGAVSDAKSFKIATLKPADGQLFRLRLEPEGLLFQDGKDAILTITLPSGVSFPSTGGFRYNGTILPFTKNADGSLTVSLSTLLGTLNNTARLKTARMLARTADFLINTAAAATVAQCGSQPMAGSAEEGLSAELNTELDVYIDCMQSAIQSLQINGQFADAMRASLAIAALNQGYASDTKALAAIPSAQQSACSIYDDVLTHLTSTPVDKFGVLSGLIERAMFWEKVTRQLGGCDFEYDPQTIVNSKAEEAEAFYKTQEDELAQSSTSQDYNQGLQEAGALSVVHDEAAVLEVTSFIQPVDNAARPEVESGLIAAPWKDCHDNGDYAGLIRLRDSLPDNTAVQTAAQYCATWLNATVKDDQGAVKVMLSPALGGVSVSQKIVSGSVAVKKGQQIMLSGPIKALGCPSGSSTSEALEVKFNGVALAPLSGGDYLVNPLTYQVNDLLSAANLNNTPENQLTSYPLTLSRTGNTCGGFWGADPQPLLTLTLNFSSSCQPPAGASFCIVPILDQQGLPMTGAMLGLNDQGTVLIYADSRHSLWNAGSVTPLPLPADYVPGSSVISDRFVGLNNKGEVFGNMYQSDGRRYALVWRKQGPSYVVSTLATARGRSSATGINDDGVVVGEDEVRQSTPCCIDYPIPIAWLADGTSVPLQGLNPGDEGSAHGINSAGLVVGRKYDGDRLVYAKWQLTNGMVGAATPPPPSGRPTNPGDNIISALLGVDDFGNMVGSISDGLDRGTKYYDANNAVVAPPTGFQILFRTLGLGGDDVVYNENRDRQALFNIHTLKSVEVSNSIVDPSLGWNFQGAIRVESQPFDRLGRLVGTAQRNGVDTPFILIPKGKPMPLLPAAQ